MIPRLVVASKNPDKINEIERKLSDSGLTFGIVGGLDWPDVEETGATLEENALLKARAVVEATGLPAVADDTGLEVNVLNGAPGVNSARFAGPNATYEDNVTRLLKDLNGLTDRSARFRTVAVLRFMDGIEIVAHGVLDGVITETPRGSGGFGYDSVFEVDGQTLAEMSPEEKNGLSHRARALDALTRAMGL